MKNKDRKNVKEKWELNTLILCGVEEDCAFDKEGGPEKQFKKVNLVTLFSRSKFKFRKKDSKKEPLDLPCLL